MDERAAQHTVGPVGAPDVGTRASARPAEGARIDGPRSHDAIDMAVVLRNVADRLDEVLDATDPAAEGVGSERARAAAANAWSTAMSAPGASAARQQALGTTVLRMTSGGSARGVDVAEASPAPNVGTAIDVPVPPAPAEAPASIPALLEGDEIARSDADARLRSARERLIRRHAEAAMAEEPRTSWWAWVRRDPRTLRRRLAAGAAIVALSVVVSLLAF